MVLCYVFRSTVVLFEEKIYPFIQVDSLQGKRKSLRLKYELSYIIK